MGRFKKLIKLCFAPVILWAAASHSAAQLEPRVYEATPGLKAFSAAKLAYLSGAYTEEADLLKLVQDHVFYDVPYEGAKLLEAELEKGRIQKSSERYIQLAGLYSAAREDELARKILAESVDLNKQTEIKLFDDIAYKTSFIELLSQTQQCETLETLITTNELSAAQTAKAKMFLGICFYETAQFQAPDMTCTDFYDESKKSDWLKFLQSAKLAFDSVSQQTREKENAKKWIKFIDEEVDSRSNKCGWHCGFNERELCYQKIKGAYAEEVFVGKLIIPTECKPYKESYDKNFRVATPRN